MLKTDIKTVPVISLNDFMFHYFAIRSLEATSDSFVMSLFLNVHHFKNLDIVGLLKWFNKLQTNITVDVQSFSLSYQGVSR